MNDLGDAGVEPCTVAAWARHLGCDPTAVRADHLRRELARGTLPDRFMAAARAHPNATLQIDRATLTHEQLHDLAARAARVLIERGLSHGVRVVLAAHTSMCFVVGYLASLYVGATVVLANPGYATGELRSLVERSRARVVLSDDNATPESLHALSGSAPHGVVLPLTELVHAARQASPAHPARVSADDVALLAFTSGTTGAPKGVPLTHSMLLSSIRGVMSAWRWSAEDTLVHTLPLFHQHGLGGLHASLLAGSRAVLLSNFEPVALMRAIDEAGATVLFGVPSIHQRLLSLSPDELVPMRRLRLVTSGSAPLAPAVFEEFRTRAGVPPLERYGLTESGLNASNPYAGERLPGSVGFPLPGVEVALLDDDGTLAPAGEEGEIALRGPQVFTGYLDDPDATRAAFWPGGWFRTGDLGRYDAEGRLVISGRLKDLVITGGMNVSPLEVEQVIEAMSGVREVGVAGTRSARWGEEVTAWVVTEHEADVSEEAVVTFCRERIAAFKCPKRVHLVDRLPRNPMGKVVRADLPGWRSGGA